MRTARLTASGFLIGGAIHLASFALLAFGVELYGHAYPPLRHLVMAAIDVPVGYVGLRRPRWLPAVLPVYLAQRLAFNPVDSTAVVVAVAWVAIVVETGWRRSPGKCAERSVRR